MLSSYKRKANNWTLLGALAIGAGLAMVLSLDRDVVKSWRETWPAAAPTVVGVTFFLRGCWCYAKSKGHSGLWGVPVPVGFAVIGAGWLYVGTRWLTFALIGGVISFVGLVILAFLPDKHLWSRSE